MSKSDFVRSLPADMPAREVLEKAKEAGYAMSPALVYMARQGGKKAKKVGRPAGKSKGASVTRAPKGGTSFETKFADMVAEIGLVRAEEMIRAVRARFTAVAR
jgi:hypothetical protein